MWPIYLAAAVILLAALLLWAVWPSPRRHPARRDLCGRYIAHRGLHDLSPNTPENSLSAFSAAIAHGLAIETDIHITADGEVVVFHDDTLTRMCGDNRRVEDLTLQELCEMCLADTNEHIPSLQEALALVAGRVPLLIEFKCDAATYAPLCRAADALLSQYKGAYWMQSFYPLAVGWYRRHRPQVCRGQLAARFRGEAPVRRMLGCMLFNFMARPDFVSYDHTDAAHPMRRFVTALGALPVGWTFHKDEDIAVHSRNFKAFIFENFLPSAVSKKEEADMTR